ncbi:MAG: hypothetical protein PVS2B1_16250 [Candidatus Dormibacteraceae bacterium]
MQALEMRVEVIAKVRLHAQREDSRVVPPQVDEDELQQADQDQKARELNQLVQVVMGDRPIDYVLNDFWDRRGRGEATELCQSEDGNQSGVRPQVR